MVGDYCKWTQRECDLLKELVGYGCGMAESMYNLTMRDTSGATVQWGRLFIGKDGVGVIESHFLMGRTVRVVRESEPWEAEKQAMRKTLEAMTV